MEYHHQTPDTVQRRRPDKWQTKIGTEAAEWLLTLPSNDEASAQRPISEAYGHD